jgi:hypothetical protein
VNATLLPYVGQQVAKYQPTWPNPAQFNFLFFGIILVLMMRFRPQGFLPSRQREAELSLAGLVEAETAISKEEPAAGAVLEFDNVGVMPPGQDQTGPDARTPEVPGEAREL